MTVGEKSNRSSDTQTPHCLVTEGGWDSSLNFSGSGLVGVRL